MKAITISAYGNVDQLHEEELDIPRIANDEVLVKIKATSINPIDWKARMGFLKQMYNYY